MIDLSDYKGKRICAAVSGGADSTVLLHMLGKEAEKCGFVLSAVHCEHGIRGEESLDDRRFVEALCAERNIPLYVFSADCLAEAETKKISLETAAREFRYRSFDRVLEEGKADLIATAHHADDEAETVLFRVCRGASLAGASGMTVLRGRYLRPLLDMTKAELLAYAAENGLNFREDASNFRTDATRNKLRLDILPRLNAAVPGASGNLARFARLAAEDDEYLYSLSAKLLSRVPPEGSWDTGWRVKLSDDKPLFSRACLTALKAAGVEKDYASVHLESLFSLRLSQTGSRVSLPRGIQARKGYGEILIFRFDDEKRPPFYDGENEDEPEIPFAFGFFDGGRYEIIVSDNPEGTPAAPVGKGKRSKKTAEKAEKISFPKNPAAGAADSVGEDGWRVLMLDADKLPPSAVFRFKRQGDLFEKFGGGRKSLKKYFIDKKIPFTRRAELPVLAEKDGSEVYAVCGVEISERVKISPDTVRVAYVILRGKTE